MTAVVLPLPWPKPPLSLNDRPSHPKARNREVQGVRSAAAVACAERIADGSLDVLEPVTVTLVWFAPDRRKRDADNPVATLKALCDGLADAGLVPDDTPEWMDKRPVRIVYRKGEPGVELHVEVTADVIERQVARVAEHLAERAGMQVAEVEATARRVVGLLREP